MPGPTYWGGHILPRVEVLPARGDGIILCDYQGTAWAVYPDGTNAQLGSGGGGSGYLTGAALTGGNQTLTPGTGPISEQDMAAGLTAGNITLHLAVAGAFSGQTFMTKIAPQANSVSVINDGPAAGTLVTLATNAKIAGLSFQFNGTDWLFTSLTFLAS